MRLYHLEVPVTGFVGREFKADSDDHARAVAADLNAQTLHRHPAAVVARWGKETWTPIADRSHITPLHPLDESAHDRTGAGGRRSLVEVKLYDCENEGRHRLGELSESRQQVERALRQIGRAQAAHRAERERRVELGFAGGLVPAELIALEVERDDAMEFAIIAAKRAAAAHTYLTERGLSLTAFRHKDLVWALRDLLEHWEEWKVAERESYEHDTRWRLTKRAGKRWDAASGGQRLLGGRTVSAGPPSGPSADPQGRIKAWSGISIDDLTEDLAALRDSIVEHETVAFEWEWPDEAAAIELVGATVWAFIPLCTDIRGSTARDGVVRWERAWLLAADRAIREQRWIIDGQVLGPREGTS